MSDPRVSPPEVSSLTIGQHLAAGAQRELDALRAELDVRLSALETALAHPDPRTSLADLVLKLARVATAEAEASTARAALEAQLHEQQLAAAAKSEALRALDAERASVNALKGELDQARAALAAEREAASALRREFDGVRKSLEEERIAGVEAAGVLERTQAALVDALAGGDGALRSGAQLEEALRRERERAASLEAGLARQRDASARMTQAMADLQEQLAAAQRAGDTRAASDETRRAEVEALERRCAELDRQGAAAVARADAAAREREESSAALDAARKEAAAARGALEERAAGLDAARAKAEQDCKAAEALAEEAIAERDKSVAALEAVRQGADAARSEAETRVAAAAAERAKAEAQWKAAEARADEATAERERLTAALGAAGEDAAVAAAIRAAAADAEHNWKAAEARAEQLTGERDKLLAALESLRQEAASERAALENRTAAVDAERTIAQENWQAAEGRAREVEIERDRLDAMLEAAKKSVQAMRDAVESRLAAIDAKRTQTVKAWKEAEARAEELTRERDELIAELETLRHATPEGPVARELEAANERIRVLELLMLERDKAPGEGDVDLGVALETKPSPPSGQAGQRATRYAFPPKTKVNIDGDLGVLVDLSVTGAQVICASSPEVGRVVTLALLSDEAPCFCQGRLLWARREPSTKGRLFKYRAGLVFTEMDERAIEAFIKQHAIT